MPPEPHPDPMNIRANFALAYEESGARSQLETLETRMAQLTNVDFPDMKKHFAIVVALLDDCKKSQTSDTASLKENVKELKNALLEMNEKMNSFRAAIEERLEQQEDKLTDLVEDRVLDIYERMFNKMKEMLATQEIRIQSAVAAEISSVEKKLSNRIEAVDNKLSDVNNKLSDKIDAVDNKLSDKIDAVDNKLSDKIDDVDNKLSDKIDAVNRKIEVLSEGLRAIADRLEESISLNPQPPSTWFNLSMMTVSFTVVLVALVMIPLLRK